MSALRRKILCVVLVFGSALLGFSQTQGPVRKKDLLFSVRPTKSVFELGANIAMEFTLKNISQRRVLATRGASLHDFTYVDIIDERGRRIEWKGVISNRAYSPDFFVILEPGQSSTFQAVISYSDGLGYQIRKPGTYRVQAEFSLTPKDYFEPVSKGADVPDRPVISNWTRFSVVQKTARQLSK